MFLAIVRSKKGVKFTDNENSVKAIFVLGGTRDKRVLHLKTIASIATLIGSPDFQQNWQNTNDKIELKNLMILNSRKRFH
jgi:basic amino acid/polyamine antiporter, APA family